MIGWPADVVLAQQVKDPKVTETRTKTSSLLIEIERIGCRGTCPAYDVTVYTDGSVVYDGKRFVKFVGRHEGKLTTSALEELRREVSRARQARFQTNYSDQGCGSIFTDYPWTIFRWRVNGKVKSIQRSHGCFGGTQKFSQQLTELDGLEQTLGRMVELEQWIGTEDERKDFEYRSPLNLNHK